MCVCVCVCVFSDLPSVVSVWPYFWPADVPLSDDGVHLIVCVHGLDGQSVSSSLSVTSSKTSLLPPYE